MEPKTKTLYSETDSELIYMIKENSEDAKEELYRKYSGLIHKEINRFKPKANMLGIDPLDLMQEALLGFMSAVNTYDENNDAKFITYATMCIRRKLLNYMEKHSSIKNQTLSNAISLDDDNSLLKYIKDDNEKEPLHSIIYSEQIEELNEKISDLTEKERTILELSITGLKAEDIAEKLKMPVKQVYNILYRTRKKIKSE